MKAWASNHLLDVRALPSTRETLAYKDGGLFPVLALAANGVVIAVVRGGAGHLGRSGRIKIIRSFDGSLAWSPPSVVADSEWDDRNPALGVSRRGTLILAYHRQGRYDDQGNFRDDLPPVDQPVAGMLTRSFDSGLTWEKPRPLGIDLFRRDSAFGKIVSLPDGTLLLPIYGALHPTLVSEKARDLSANAGCNYLLRSRDDGQTWGEPSLIAVDVNETALVVLPDGALLAAMHAELPNPGLRLARSQDGGLTWSEPVQLTGRRQAPGDCLLLSNRDLLLTYGNRNPPYRIEGLVSRDGGHS
ncbi:MAG: glycoside hydrolase [Chloroflexi bacterium]|nr:glycoside hydrolase [Chloroflexota bacterium]